MAKYEIQETLNFSHNTNKFVAWQMVLLHNKLITQGEKYKTSTQNLQRNNVAWQGESLAASSPDFWSDDSFYQGWHPGEGEEPHMKQTGMLVGNFEFNP